MDKSITLKPLTQFGRVDYLPKCELSKALCDLLNSRSLGIKTIEKLAKHNFKIYYSLDENDATLESLGAKRV